MKKIAKIICPFVFVLFSIVAYAQENNDIAPPPPVKSYEEIEKNKSFDFVQQMPEFPGGQDSLNSFLQKNLVYPDSAQKNGIQGKVFVAFVVEKNGSIAEVITLGKPKGYGLEEESLRVVNMMPNWIPGKQNGKLVRVKFTLPINFRLTN